MKKSVFYFLGLLMTIFVSSCSTTSNVVVEEKDADVYTMTYTEINEENHTRVIFDTYHKPSENPIPRQEYRKPYTPQPYYYGNQEPQRHVTNYNVRTTNNRRAVPKSSGRYRDSGQRYPSQPTRYDYGY